VRDPVRRFTGRLSWSIAHERFRGPSTPQTTARPRRRRVDPGPRARQREEASGLPMGALDRIGPDAHARVVPTGLSKKAEHLGPEDPETAPENRTFGKHSRVEDDKRIQRNRNSTRTMPCGKKSAGGEVRLLAWGEPFGCLRSEGNPPSKSGESRYPFQPPTAPGSRREIRERPGESTSDGLPQIASVSSDRRAQELT
jgi:hypothetical protein